MATTGTKPAMKVPAVSWLGICLSLVMSQSAIAQDLAMEAQAAFQYLNRMRISVHMIPFRWSPILQESSANHARYLTRNHIISHLEKSGTPYFTGSNPGERALARGYEVRNVTENYSVGGKDPLESVDGLMGAIYHRFGFLDFAKDEIGISVQDTGSGFNIVYNMGNSRLNRFCRVAIDTGEGSYYKDICKQQSRVPAETFDKLIKDTRLQNPPLVVWPPDKSTGIPTVFYEEIPDPLPNLSVSGYPVSIQFNPAVYSQIRLLYFELYKQSVEHLSEVTPVHLLHKRNDPHQKFTDREFALFPLNRLEWNTRYQARVVYAHQGKEKEHVWTFTTTKLTQPMFVIAANGEGLKLITDKTYAIYIPPGDRLPFIEQLNVESPYTVSVSVDWEDKNTILLMVSGKACQPVRFFLNGDRFFTVFPGNTDNLNREQYYPELPEEGCL